ncbi:MAG: hypothetical protein JW953_22360 [Anaerolineae bacterium]|nr:hypothetical protein [Anaerolineae bacterium]
MQAIKENPRGLFRIVLLGLFVLALLCLVGALVYNLLLTNGDEVVVDTPTPTVTPTEGPEVVASPEEPTATPTLVVIEETPIPTEESTAEPTEEPTAIPTPTKQPSDTELLPVISPGAIEDLLKNGDFEEGFDAQGVALEWQNFQTDSVAVNFSRETAIPYIKSGSAAQRITLAQATQPNRYAGIFQQVNIVPNEPYSVTLHGQIRTGFADVNQSSYGYRMQYAVDHSGDDNWQNIPETDWIELPWDEQLLNSAEVKFLEYATTITSTSEQITLFVRAWNKWADPGEVQYTLDDLSLVGPSPRVGSPETEEALIDQPLPTTGEGDSANFIGSGPFWGALLVLLLLAAGAIYRAKWSY